jgi:hypothetical protein
LEKDHDGKRYHYNKKRGPEFKYIDVDEIVVFNRQIMRLGMGVGPVFFGRIIVIS